MTMGKLTKTRTNKLENVSNSREERWFLQVCKKDAILYSHITLPITRGGDGRGWWGGGGLEPFQLHCRSIFVRSDCRGRQRWPLRSIMYVMT